MSDDAEGEWDDPVTIRQGVVVAREGDALTLYAVGMSDDEGFEWVRAFVRAMESTRGMTRQ